MALLARVIITTHHCRFQCWRVFSSFAGEQYKRRAFDPTAVGLEGLEWDGAELFMVGGLTCMLAN